MSHDSNDWLKELAQDPFPQKGFTNEMKRNIMGKLEQKPQSRFRLFYYGFAGMAVLFLLLFAGRQLMSSDVLVSLEIEEIPLVQDVKSGVSPDEEIHTVLLLGFRNDHDEQKAPSYRTLMLAEIDGEMHTAASGSGILVPYGQNFWQIDSVPEDNMTRLKIRKAGEQEWRNRPSLKDGEPLIDNEPAVRKDEALLFAGKQYLTVELTAQATEASKENAELYTIDLQDFAAGVPLDQSAVNLNEISASLVDTDTWMLFRQQGKWMAAVKDEPTGSLKSPGGIHLSRIETELPASLVSYDQMDISWEEVLEIQPYAIDAFSSYDHDMIGILTPTALEIYPARTTEAVQNLTPLLRVSKDKEESLVMIHWATERYREKWLEVGKNQLKNDNLKILSP